MRRLASLALAAALLAPGPAAATAFETLAREVSRGSPEYAAAAQVFPQRVRQAARTPGAAIWVHAVDLNGDGRNELFVMIAGDPIECSHANGCPVFLIGQDRNGRWRDLSGGFLSNGSLEIANSRHHGYRDFIFTAVTNMPGMGFPDSRCVYQYNGSVYSEPRCAEVPAGRGRR